MQYALVAAIVLHVLGAVYWAGSTFTLTRLGGERAEQFSGPQMGAAALAISDFGGERNRCSGAAKRERGGGRIATIRDCYRADPPARHCR